jgi:hypothetical protein
MNIRLGWRGLPETNALADCEHSYITDVKSLKTSHPGVDVIKLVTLIFERS